MFALADFVVQFEAARGRTDEVFVVVAGEHQDVFRIEARDFAHHLHEVVDVYKPGAFLVDALENVVRHDGFQGLKVAVAPKLEHIQRQANQRVITFRVDLFAEEMHQFVLSARDFVHVGGHVADFAFRADFVEIDGENARQLLHLFIIRCDVGVQNLRDFALEEVGVAEENAAQLEVHDQGGKQFLHRRLGVLNQFEPHTDILDMVLIHRELPVLANEHVAWRDEPESDEFLLEIIDDFLHLGLVDVDDFETQSQLEIEHG